MKKCQLGKSGINVTKIGLGCMLFGSSTEQNISFRIMDKYISEGGNFLDTSNNYAFWVDNCIGGESEKIIGKWVTSRKNREKIVLATKIGALPNKIGLQDLTNIQGNSQKVIFEEIDLSLKRLNTDYVDLLYLHVDDRKTDLFESIKALNDLRKQGKIRAYGISNIKTWRLHEARMICEQNNYPFFSAVQQKNSYIIPKRFYNSGVQEFVNDELIDYKKTFYDFSLVSYSIMLNGILKENKIEDIDFKTEENIKKLQEVNLKGIPWVYKKISEQFEDSIALMSTSSEKHLQEVMEQF